MKHVIVLLLNRVDVLLNFIVTITVSHQRFMYIYIYIYIYMCVCVCVCWTHYLTAAVAGAKYSGRSSPVVICLSCKHVDP
jgi:hypothetical protein